MNSSIAIKAGLPVLVFALSLVAPLNATDKSQPERGNISGTVRLTGEAPKALAFEVPKDNDWCGRRKALPRLVVSKDRGVKNSVVFLDGISSSEAFIAPAKLTLEQKRCEYSPHVLLVPSGAKLEIVNLDAVLHNVHAFDSRATTVFNIAQPIRGARFPVRPALFKAGEIYEATCDAGHPWMSAFVVVAEHPYYALTDTEGKYELTNIPPGKYTVKMWHEGVNTTRIDMDGGKPMRFTFESPYVQSQEIVVMPGKTTTLDFTLELRKK